MLTAILSIRTLHRAFKKRKSNNSCPKRNASSYMITLTSSGLQCKSLNSAFEQSNFFRTHSFSLLLPLGKGATVLCAETPRPSEWTLQTSECLSEGPESQVWCTGGRLRQGAPGRSVGRAAQGFGTGGTMCHLKTSGVLAAISLPAPCHSGHGSENSKRTRATLGLQLFSAAGHCPGVSAGSSLSAWRTAGLMARFTESSENHFLGEIFSPF